MAVQVLLWKNSHQPACFSFFLTLGWQTFICNLTFASCFSPLISLSLLLSFSFLCFSFAVAVFTLIVPEEPPPRPPQPAVLIKSKSGFSQQLLTHCSCPLCSLLAPLLKGTSHIFCLSVACLCSDLLLFPFLTSLFSIFPSLCPSNRCAVSLLCTIGLTLNPETFLE